MSTAVADKMSASPQRKYRLGVTAYDRSSSLLIAMLVLVGMSVAGLLIVYLTLQLMERQIAVPITIAERPAGAPDSQGTSDELEAPAIEDAPDLQEPQLPEMLSALADAISTHEALLDRQVVQPGAEASRGDREGDPRKAGSFGTGDGSPVRWDRWKIRYQDPRSLDRYAEQLDFFGIELGVVDRQGQVRYATHLADPKPATARPPLRSRNSASPFAAASSASSQLTSRK